MPQGAAEGPVGDNWSARRLAEGWDKWYGKAEHKRLGQALLEAARNG
jgi:hypothetical protein